MKFIVAIFVGLIALAGTAVAHYRQAHPIYRYRYKLTLEVSVDGEIKQASSVVEVRNYKVSFPQSGVRNTITGEALYVDLGQRHPPLIALITKHDQSIAAREGRDYRGWGESEPNVVLARGYGDPWPKRGNIDSFWARASDYRGQIELTPTQLPDLVTFRDINNPKTVVAVDPNDLEAALGRGVRWRHIWIEITDDPITSGIELKLPWMANLRWLRASLDGDTRAARSSDALSNRLGTGAFKQ